MLPTAFVVVLAAFLVQVSDAREIDRARVDGLEEYIGRNIEEKDDDSSAQKKAAGNIEKPLHKDFIKKTVKKTGFWRSLFFVNVRLVKGTWSLIREFFALPYYVFRISQYKAMGLLGKD